MITAVMATVDTIMAVIVTADIAIHID